MENQLALVVFTEFTIYDFINPTLSATFTLSRVICVCVFFSSFDMTQITFSSIEVNDRSTAQTPHVTYGSSKRDVPYANAQHSIPMCWHQGILSRIYLVVSPQTEIAWRMMKL